MAYRVSLTIDGSATTAVKAANDTAAAVTSLGAKAQAVAQQQTAAAATLDTALTGTAGSLAAVTAGMGGVAAASHAVVEAEEEAAVASAAVTRELIVLGREGLVGNFSRLPGSVLALSERLQGSGASALNLKTILGIVGSVAGTVFNPAVLGTVAFTVVLGEIPELLSLITSGVGSADRVLKEHHDTLQSIKKAWDDASAAEAQYSQRVQTGINFSGTADKLQSQLLLRSEQKRLSFDLAPAPLQGDPNSAFNQIATMQAYIDKYGVLATAVQKFAQASANGKGDVLAFNAEIEKIALADPANEKLTALALSLLKMTSDATGAANALTETDAALAKLTLTNSRSVEGTNVLSYMNKSANALQDLSAQRSASLQGIYAQSPSEKAAAASASVLAQPLDLSESPDVRNYKAATAGALAYAAAVHSLTQAQQERDQSLDQTIQSSQLDLDLVGKSVGQAAALRLQFQLTSAVQAEAARNGVAVDQAELKRIAAKSAAYGALAQKIAETQKLSDLQFDTSQLTRSPTEQTVASTLRSIYGDDWQAQLNGAIAGQIRLNASIQAGRDAWTDFGGEAFDALQSIIQGSDSAGDAVLKLVEDLLLAEAKAQFLDLLVPGSGGTGPLSALLSVFGLGGATAGVATGAPMSILPPGLASGGQVRGPGSPTSDSIWARLSNGEHVINAYSAARHRPLLDAINDNRVPGFADGGPVYVGPPRLSVAGGMAASSTTFPISINPQRGATNEEIAEAGAKAIKEALDDYDRKLPDRVSSIARNPRRRG